MNNSRDLVRIGAYMGFTSLSEFLKQAADLSDANVDYNNEIVNTIIMNLLSIFGELESVLSYEDIKKVGDRIGDAISIILEAASKGRLKTKQRGIDLWKQLKPGNPPINVDELFDKG